jgi:hypothetical protein
MGGADMTRQGQPTTAEPTWASEREHRRVFRSQFPETDSVMAGLATVLGNCEPPEARLITIKREPNEWRSTFPSEVVTCRFGDGREVRVLCKYGLTDYVSGHGHRGGVEREALVYTKILNPLGFRPHCYGTHSNGDGDTWLILEYIDGVPRLELAEEGIPVLALAARWSGTFHAATTGGVVSGAAAYLNTYDRAYFAAWCERTIEYGGPWHTEFPWLRAFCARFAEVAGDMLSGDEVVVHGEYTPHNVLARHREMFPVDWESAAIGAGEIDLASLTDMWPADLVDESVAEYKRARWPGGAPAAFERRLVAARIYWVLRWLGNRPDLTAREKNRPRFDLLHEYGGRLGLI